MSRFSKNPIIESEEIDYGFNTLPDDLYYGDDENNVVPDKKKIDQKALEKVAENEKHRLTTPANLKSKLKDLASAIDRLNEVLDDDERAADLRRNFGEGEAEATIRAIDRDGRYAYEIFEKLVNDPETAANWVQYIEHNDSKIGARELTTKNKQPKGGEFRGKDAIAEFTKYLGLGNPIQMPLWHSGFHIALSPITETEMINLENAIANTTTILGRHTNTLIYSNYSVAVVKVLMDFIVRKLIMATVTLNKKEDIVDLIKIQDLPFVALALVKSMYPNGYNDTRRCVNSTVIEEDGPNIGKVKCDNVINSKIEPLALQFVDKSKLSDEHILHMSKVKPNSVSVSEVREYQNTMHNVSDSKDFTLSIDENVTFTIRLKNISIKDYIEKGEIWVNHIEKLVNGVTTTKSDEKNKLGKAITYSKSMLLTQYSPYFESVTFGDNITTDDKAIHGIFEKLSGIDKVAEEVQKKINEHIVSSTIAIVGVPIYVCPKCNSVQGEGSDVPGMSDIIPMNVLEVFSTLYRVRLAKIKERDLS